MMLDFVTTKIMRALVTLWLVVTAVFLILKMSGDPIEIMLGDDADPDVVAHYRALYGLDQPLYVQYFRYFNGILQGDLGFSLIDQQEVVALVLGALPNTLLLGGTALLLSLLVGIPLGVVAALRRNSAIDRFTMSFAVLGFSLPNFFLGILLIMVFSLWLRWLPSSGIGTLAHLVMPALTLGLSGAGAIARFTRSSMLEVLSKAYMRSAKAKGVPQRLRIQRHAAPNAAIPLITILGFRLGDLVAGSIVTEVVFAWPGVGRLLVSAVSSKDLAVVQGILLMVTCTMVLANLLVDLSYGWIDPRIRTRSESSTK